MMGADGGARSSAPSSCVVEKSRLSGALSMLRGAQHSSSSTRYKDYGTRRKEDYCKSI